VLIELNTLVASARTAILLDRHARLSTYIASGLVRAAAAVSAGDAHAVLVIMGDVTLMMLEQADVRAALDSVA
jgi:hypothetical protein